MFPDRLHAGLVVDGGSLAILIQKEGEAPVYENDARSEAATFDLEIETGGIYTVAVTGEQAKGSVSFVAGDPRD